MGSLISNEPLEMSFQLCCNMIACYGVLKRFKYPCRAPLTSPLGPIAFSDMLVL